MRTFRPSGTKREKPCIRGAFLYESARLRGRLSESYRCLATATAVSIFLLTHGLCMVSTTVAGLLFRRAAATTFAAGTTFFSGSSVARAAPMCASTASTTFRRTGTTVFLVAHITCSTWHRHGRSVLIHKKRLDNAKPIFARMERKPSNA